MAIPTHDGLSADRRVLPWDPVGQSDCDLCICTACSRQADCPEHKHDEPRPEAADLRYGERPKPNRCNVICVGLNDRFPIRHKAEVIKGEDGVLRRADHRLIEEGPKLCPSFKWTGESELTFGEAQTQALGMLRNAAPRVGR